MKHKPQKAPKMEEEQDTPKLGDMYCTTEIGKILHSRTLEELGKLGLKEDFKVSYIKILLMVAITAIGGYSAVFTSVEKSKWKLQLTVVSFFFLLAVLTIYEKVFIRGASFRLHIGDGDKVYIWCSVNWKNATCDIAYSFTGSSTQETYQIPIGDMFFEDGKLDEGYYHKEMVKLCKEIEDAHSKKTA